VAVLDFDVHHGNGTEEGFRPHDSLFYGSTHQFEAYPGTGKDPSPKVGELASLEINRRIVNRYLVTDQAQSTQKQFRTKWRQVVEEMVRFRPGLVIFSAGFDAHDADPLADCELQEEDFSWATDIVLEACVRINPEAPPKCVSILEGGYDLEALGLSTAAHVRSLAKGFPVTPAPVAATAAAAAADGEAPVKPEVVGDEVAALAKFLKDVGL
jgi:acetoin utilization deacetylase AcuC-like enzyme